MVSRQWSDGSRQWSAGSGQLSAGSGHLSVVSGLISVVSGLAAVVSGLTWTGLRAVDGKLGLLSAAGTGQTVTAQHHSRAVR